MHRELNPLNQAVTIISALIVLSAGDNQVINKALVADLNQLHRKNIVISGEFINSARSYNYNH